MKKREKQESISLSVESSERVTLWLEQIHAKKNIDLTRKAFVNWLITSKPTSLPASEISVVIDKFYDVELFLKRMLRDLQKSKKEGNSREPVELIVKPKIKRAKRKESAALAEVPIDKLISLTVGAENKEA